MIGHPWISPDADQFSFVVPDPLSDASEAAGNMEIDRDPMDSILSGYLSTYRAQNRNAELGDSVRVDFFVESVHDRGSFVVDERIRADRPPLRHRTAWGKRIEDLRSWAEEDGDPFRSESERDFWAFVEATPDVRRGGLVLVCNGNLRAVWDGDAGASVGLQFLGNGVVQYVLFRRGSDVDQRWPEGGRDDFDGFMRRVHSLDLESVVLE